MKFIHIKLYDNHTDRQEISTYTFNLNELKSVYFDHETQSVEFKFPEHIIYGFLLQSDVEWNFQRLKDLIKDENQQIFYIFLNNLK